MSDIDLAELRAAVERLPKDEGQSPIREAIMIQDIVLLEKKEILLAYGFVIHAARRLVEAREGK